MQCPTKFRTTIFRSTSPAATTVAALLFALVLTFAATPSMQAQTLHVLYSFTGGPDGRYPFAGVIFGADGNLYGTTAGDCTSETIDAGCGTVFRLTNSQSGWHLTTLYSFRGGYDGSFPGQIVFSGDGNLYGTTFDGGGVTQQCPSFGCGTVFELVAGAGGSWTERVLYRFQGPPDGQAPVGAPVFDAGGNMYGATYYGGLYQCSEGEPCGAAYRLTPSNGGWEESVIWNFGAGNDGYRPNNLIIDSAGNLYGTTLVGGQLAGDEPLAEIGSGVAFELSPTTQGWAETILYDFNIPSLPLGSGLLPNGGLTFDRNGNLDGVTYANWQNDGGSVFQLVNADGSWGFQTLFDLVGGLNSGAYGNLAIDASGNLYGLRYDGVPNGSTVYKLTDHNGRWSYSVLHSFSGASEDVYVAPYLTLDSQGNLYGSTTRGGAYGYGMVFEITP